MWWAIGIAVLVVVVFVVVKFRSTSHQMELAAIVRNHLTVSFRMLTMFESEIDRRVWSDPYLLGYAHGSTVMLLALFGKKLSPMQKGMVSVDALKELIGEGYRDVSERMISLYQVRNSEFVRGEQHGSDVMALMFNQAGPELLADPDVQAAMREAPAARKVLGDAYTNNGPLADAGGALMRMHMNRHKAEAGY